MLTVSNLHKSYPEAHGALDVLRGVEFVAGEGQIIAVTGASGSGKSTLLNLLGGLDNPDRGAIRYGDVDIASLRANRLAEFRNQKIGFIFQFHHLLPEFDALENVLMPGLIQGKKMNELAGRGKELLAAIGLAERASHRPQELSGGECQRVAVARALMNQPDVILADEPSGNLDKVNSEKLHQLMRDLSREKRQTFIIATHNEHLASIADKIFHLSEGVLSETK